MPNDDLTYVNFGGMETGAANFGRVAKALEEAINDMNTQVMQHFSDWVGAAKGEYTAKHAQWKGMAGEMNAQVVNLQSVIQQAHENYGTAEGRNTAIWT